MTPFNYLDVELVKRLSVDKSNVAVATALLEIAYQLRRIADKLEEK